MPIKKAAIKALRQTKKHTLTNKKIKNALRDIVKRSRNAINEKKLEQAKELVKQTAKTADKAVRAKIIKQNTASRIKSRLAKKLSALMKK